MKRPVSSILFLCLALGGVAPLAAQDLTITNAHIVVGNGTVIERGSIVVRGGKIVSVAAGAPSAKSGQTIDAKGMSAMAGFIDAHKHVNTGPDEKAQMQRLLEAGYTTVLSGGGPAEGNITLRDHIEQGVINGPRIIPSGSLRLANHTPDSAREEIRKMAAMGIKYTGEIALTPVPGPSEKELETLRAVLDEGEEGRRDGAGSRRELARDDGRRRRGHSAARAHPEQGLGQQGGRRRSSRRRARRR